MDQQRKGKSLALEMLKLLGLLELLELLELIVTERKRRLQIAQQNTSSIRYLNEQHGIGIWKSIGNLDSDDSDNHGERLEFGLVFCRIAFSIVGANTKLQYQALEALAELLERKAPSRPKLPSKPIRDTPLDSASQDEASDNKADEGCDVAPSDVDLPKVTRQFRAHERIRDPYKMFYAEKTQKIDTPTLLAKTYECDATLSDDGRSVEIKGVMDNVRKCITKLEQIQEYFLRTPFRMDQASLVYASHRQEFRLIFVAVVEHSYFSKNIKYLPAYLTKRNPTEFCVVEMGVYDASLRTWTLRNG
ncbi:hypothetical protein BGZ65_010165, partial [Modicella reniformis]